MSPGPRVAPALLPLLALAALVGAGCGEIGGEDAGPEAGATVERAGSAQASALAAGGETPGASDSASTGGEAGVGATLPVRALRSYPLRLVNVGEEPAIMLGRAGAREVVLDTVAAGDSVLLEVRLRTDTLEIRATDRSGELLGNEIVRFSPEPEGDGVPRVEVP